MVRAYMSLGSNIEPRREHLSAALRALGQGLGLAAVSHLYETEPVDVLDQAWFLNLAVALDTDLQPLALLKAMQAIEAQAGKKVLFRRGPRTLDLDLLLYGDSVLQTESLTLPHPKMLEREFVLRPLCDIAPEARHPLAGASAAQLLERLPKGGPVVRDLGTLDEV